MAEWKPAAQRERERISKRAKKFIRTPGSDIAQVVPTKTPSELSSDRMRKRLMRHTDKNFNNYKDDCRDCPKHPCGKTIDGCDEPSRRNVCKVCGQKIHYRVIEGKEWDGLCPVHREQIKQ